MRFAVLTLLLLPAAGLAETFTVPSKPTSVTVYSDAAIVTRRLEVELPAGVHQVILPDLPVQLDADSLRLSVVGAALGSTQLRARAVPPKATVDSAEIAAAKDAIEAAEEALLAFDDRVAEARLGASAAQAKIGFLSDLGKNEGLAGDIDTLQNLARMIEQETLAAQQTALQAEAAARDLARERKKLEQDLKDAQAALAALTPPAEQKAQLTVTLNAATEGVAQLDLSYPVYAAWRPAYDVYLTEGSLDLRRGAYIYQESGEAWEEVEVTLSTLRPTGQLAPAPVYEKRRRIEEPPKQVARAQADFSVAAGAAPVLESPVIAEESAVASFDGPGVSYMLPSRLTLASGVDESRVAMDQLQFEARRFARANPLFDTTAFLMAEFTNTSQEPLLAGDEALFFLDNTLIGRGFFPAVPAGGEGALPFGPIEDLRLTHKVLSESEGDRGLITRTNQQDTTVRMEVENIGPSDWQVEVQAAVSYATQEDLQIDWSATPAPDVVDLEDRRGVLEWTLDVAAGDTRTIEVREELDWPENMILR